MKFVDKVRIHHSVCYDFLCSISRLANDESFQPSDKPNQEIIEWAAENSAKITPDIRKQLDTFFNLETWYGMLLVGYIGPSRATNVSELVSHLQGISSEEILCRFLHSGIGPGRDIDTNYIRLLTGDHAEALRFVDEYLTFSPKEKWQVLQFLMNPNQMKKSLLGLLQWHYEQVYCLVEEKIEKKLYGYERELSERLKRYGDEYLGLLVPLDNLRDLTQITLALSYFYERSSMYNILEDTFVLGYRYSETIEGQHSILAGTQIFKVLGDETRLNIIRLLAKRPHYGHELAQTLNISNSTVSHHVTQLALNGLVKASRVENRVYFSVDKESMRYVINDALEKILQ